jgi:hypothetical protein
LPRIESSASGVMGRIFERANSTMITCCHSRLSVARAVFLIASIASLTLPAGTASAAPSLFDKPVKVVRIPLPADPENPQAKARVSCFYFPHFMVKEIDLGEKGSEQLSLVPLGGAQDNAPCRRENSPSEKVLADWDGYFEGVKGDDVFFTADDGWNDGTGFAIFSGADGTKLFEDVTKKGFRAIAATPSGVTLRYERVFGASCSLADDKAGCWEKIKQDTGLAGASPPDCIAAYRREQKRVPAFAQQTLKDPTIIDYEVTVAIESGKGTIVPVSGKALRCRPSE